MEVDIRSNLMDGLNEVFCPERANMDGETLRTARDYMSTREPWKIYLLSTALAILHFVLNLYKMYGLINKSILGLKVARLTPACNRYVSGLESLETGRVLHGYKLEQIDYIKELNIRPYFLRHQLTGAEHLHISKDGDSNNVFAVSLRTTPKNSTGIAHILEHVTLCGSDKYPIRDPFFKMLTRSLATFMNAMTGPDYTVYPFSTQNKKDFENLFNIYTDAVFFPRLRAVDFRQEGWRLEHEKADQKETPIIIKGVVYNEMKGAFASSSSIYCRQLLNNLFPDTTYQYESGGDPDHIPHLTHGDLKKFQKLHYHPSNAKFFTYGDIPLEDHLKLLNETVMSKFSENPRAREQSFVSDQVAWTQPKTVDITCPLDPFSAYPDKQTTTSVSYMLPTKSTNFKDMFAIQLLASLLVDGPNAPFYKSLIESGLGSDYAPSTGLANYTKQPYFSVGLQNIHKDSIDQVLNIIEKTFEEVKSNGFPRERVDAVLHNIELGLKHVSSNFGFRLLMSLGTVMNHDGDSIDFLRINQQMNEFRSALESDDQYWSKLIDKYFLNNTHKLILNMSPDERFEDKRNDREKTLIEDKVNNLSDSERQTVLYEGMELMKIHNAREDPSILPCLDPSKDIPREMKDRTKLIFDSYKGVKVQICEQPTNEVVYFKALSDLSEIIEDDDPIIDYLPLFCDVATKLGAGVYNRHELSQKAQLTTGGLGTSLLLNPSLADLDIYKKEVMIGSHCLTRNIDHMFDLWTNIFEQIHFQQNKEYLFQLIKSSAAEMAESIPHIGSTYAMKRSASSISKVGALDERLSGLSFVARMKDMASNEPVDSIASKLQLLASLAFNPYNLRCAINAEPESIQKARKSLDSFIDSAQKAHVTGQVGSTNLNLDYKKTEIEDMQFKFATHYVAKSFLTVPRLHEDFAKLVIMSKLISYKFLLREVREKGGAYGAALRLSNSGVMSFSSNRDPNTERTLKAFEAAYDWVTSGEEITSQDVEESKLCVFQDVDRPVEPGKRGLNFFINGETDEIRQEYRKLLLDVTKDDITEVAKKYLGQTKHASYVI